MKLYAWACWWGGSEGELAGMDWGKRRPHRWLSSSRTIQPFNPATTIPVPRLNADLFANGHRPKVLAQIYNVLAQLVACKFCKARVKRSRISSSLREREHRRAVQRVLGRNVLTGGASPRPASILSTDRGRTTVYEENDCDEDVPVPVRAERARRWCHVPQVSSRSVSASPVPCRIGTATSCASTL